MRNNQECSGTTDSAAWRGHGRLSNLMKTYRRWGGLAVFVAAAAVALTAFSGTNSSRGASLGKNSRAGNSGGSSRINGRRARSATALAKNNSNLLLSEWTTCERSHGDSDQADPTVDAHGVISITIPMGTTPIGDPHDVTGTCSNYLAAARRVLAGDQPIEGWGDRAKYVEYANCMRANGYPKFPYPSGIEPDGNESTNFNGTGINPESPAFLNGNANQACGKQIGAPAWWINSWGPPGDVVVSSGPLPMRPPPNSPQPIPAPGASSGGAATPGQAPPAELSAKPH